MIVYHVTQLHADCNFFLREQEVLILGLVDYGEGCGVVGSLVELVEVLCLQLLKVLSILDDFLVKFLDEEKGSSYFAWKVVDYIQIVF